MTFNVDDYIMDMDKMTITYFSTIWSIKFYYNKWYYCPVYCEHFGMWHPVYDTWMVDNLTKCYEKYLKHKITEQILLS